ncbi:hypothetical protein RD055328_03880 [Companilactobacillus sp. RD055328]|uniref:hypothetical protein n=1 Tax=Companilactobacillus sp. RD055328 TaxID=2916634 RepID=UPI001FC8B8EC|nr:hypothetical protein [Companilactobacillus sp. RD055328]GKQ42465.1 hypothetical protein RD055328_03880 [Companilactobacillus sp. RD055328]
MKLKYIDKKQFLANIRKMAKDNKVTPQILLQEVIRDDILSGSSYLSDILQKEWVKHKKKFHDDIEFNTFVSNEAKGYHGKEKVTREIANGLYETDGKYWVNPWMAGFDIVQMSTTSIITSGPHMSLGERSNKDTFTENQKNEPHGKGEVDVNEDLEELKKNQKNIQGENK